MAEGKVKKLMEKGFGFIESSDGDGKDIFFHMSELDGVSFEDLKEGDPVFYNVGQGPKGPRAEQVRRV